MSVAARAVRRVLLVDDSVVVRQLLTRLLSDVPDLEVVGAAATGSIALKMAAATRPDVVILDVEMPEMSGLEVLDALLQGDFEPIVIMFSHLTDAGGAVTLDALARGAADYVTKPTGFSDREAALEHVRSQLVPRIRALSRIVEPSWPSVSPSRRAARPGPVELLAIAASTGGPNALMGLVPELPQDLPVPVLIVQHMPPLFTAQFARRLDTVSSIEVREAEDGLRLTAGRVVIARGGQHMLVAGTASDPHVRLSDSAPVNSCRPAADVSFRSAVEIFGGGVLGVVLTGMGHDGLRGAREIVEAGGEVLAQDEASSVVWGMPGAIAKAQLASGVHPLGSLPHEILERCGRPT